MQHMEQILFCKSYFREKGRLTQLLKSYIHEKGGKFKSKLIPKSFKKYSYEISEDAQKFVDNTFSGGFESTIGVDFKTKIIDVDSKKIKLQILEFGKDLLNIILM